MRQRPSQKELYRVATARRISIQLSPRNTKSDFPTQHLSPEGARTAEGR
jgi:hypothetical protein